MKWFSAKKQQQPSVNTEEKLAALKTTGISLTIDELIQYQTKSSLIDLSGSKNLHGKMSGNYLARSKGRGMEFDEVRHYQNGDDIRAIDWRVTARTGITYTKLFREEIERPVLIATDLSSSMLFGSQLLFKSVQASHLAALVAWHAKKRGDRIGGVVFNQHRHVEIKPRSRKQGVLHYLHTLVQTHEESFEAQAQIDTMEETQYFENNCARMRQLAKPGSLLYLITDGQHINDESIRHLANISRHCELVVCLIHDPLEKELPESHSKVSVSVTDGNNTQDLTLGDLNTANRYKDLANQMQQNIEMALTKAGARVINFSASESLEIQLKDGVASWNH